MDGFPLTLEVEGIMVDKIDLFGGAMTSTAQSSLPTLRNWKDLASHQLASTTTTPPDFWETIVAGKNYLTALDTGKLSQKQSASLKHGAQSFVAGDVSQEAWVTNYFGDAVTRAARGRRFFVMGKKMMGLGVPDIQLKD